MKVNVIQAEDASFKFKFSWWSTWIDVVVYDYSCTPFLLQMSVSRLNKKKFRSVRITGLLTYRQATSSGLTKLEHFAGLAMQGLLAADGCNGAFYKSMDDVAEPAIQAAKALLAELDKESYNELY